MQNKIEDSHKKLGDNMFDLCMKMMMYLSKTTYLMCSTCRHIQKEFKEIENDNGSV